MDGNKTYIEQAIKNKQNIMNDRRVTLLRGFDRGVCGRELVCKRNKNWMIIQYIQENAYRPLSAFQLKNSSVDIISASFIRTPSKSHELQKHELPINKPRREFLFFFRIY